MNNLELSTLNVDNASVGSLSITYDCYPQQDIVLTKNAAIRFESAEIYVREGRLYFSSPEVGEWALTPTKEEKVKRILDNVEG